MARLRKVERSVADCLPLQKLLEAITESSHVTRNLVPGSKNAASLSEANTGQKNKPSFAVHPAVGRLLHYRKP